MTAPTQTLAELSRAVASKKRLVFAPENPPDFTQPERLYELEGELQQAGWSFDYATNDPEGGWVAMNHRTPGVGLKEPGTAEGRARLILRAWLAMMEAKQ